MSDCESLRAAVKDPLGIPTVARLTAPDRANRCDYKPYPRAALRNVTAITKCREQAIGIGKARSRRKRARDEPHGRL